MNGSSDDRLFLAVGEVGADLVDLAENRSFRPGVWRRWGALAACMVLLVGAALAMLPRFGISLSPLAAGTEEIVVEQAMSKNRVVFRYTWYYLEPTVTETEPEDLTELLGIVESAGEPNLLDAKVFGKAGATEYTNHSVHGLTVYRQVYVQVPGGYALATTYNEKTVARYGFEDVAEAIEQGHTDWILQELVDPMIRYAGDVTYEITETLHAEALNSLFLASTRLNTGVEVSEQWQTEAGDYIIPVEDVVWRLQRFFAAAAYDPTGTEAYDTERQALVYPAAALQKTQQLRLELADCQLDPETKTAELMVHQYADETDTTPLCTRVYVIRFGTESWQYESVRTIS